MGYTAKFNLRDFYFFREIVFLKAGERGNSAFCRVPDPNGYELLRNLAPPKRRIYIIEQDHGESTSLIALSYVIHHNYCLLSLSFGCISAEAIPVINGEFDFTYIHSLSEYAFQNKAATEMICIYQNNGQN